MNKRKPLTKAKTMRELKEEVQFMLDMLDSCMFSDLDELELIERIFKLQMVAVLGKEK